MKWHFSILKKVLSGFIFLVLPLTLMIFVLMKAVGLMKKLIQPLKNILPDDKVFGVGFLTIISLLLIILLCFLAGVVIEIKMVRKFIRKLEDHVLVFIPGYSMLIQRAGDLVSETQDLRVVLVQEDQDWRPGIEVERNENGYSAIFFPGPPAGRTGFIKVVPQKNYKTVEIPII